MSAKETRIWEGDERLERFGPGPWIDEPDHIEWVYEGVPCLMQRQPHLGDWCGYAGVEPGHPWHEQHYEELPVDVHGGLTYAGPTPRQVECGVVWWLGFDCAHSGDLCPLPLLPLRSPLRYGVYRDRAYVAGHVESLARQVIAARLP